MTINLAIQIDAETKRRLDEIAERSHRSTSNVAEEAIVRYLENEAWQLSEIEAGIADVEEGRVVEHEKVSAWLKSWGTQHEDRAP